MKPRIVLSGVNLVEGGTLSIFQDALQTLSEDYLNRYEVIALVHRRNLFRASGISYQEFPKVKSSWLRRLYFEFVTSRKLSRKLAPTLWFAMHDITPNVLAPIRAVYCHNPSPFYKMPLREATLVPTFTLFRLLYGRLYSLNILKNNFVVVQQDWLRQEFKRRFHAKTIVVAHPSVPHSLEDNPEKAVERKACTFFYPSLSRPFKNFELILKSAQLLEQEGISDFEVILTIDGGENRYSAQLRKEFSDLTSIRWIGRQTRSSVDSLYEQAGCLIFPSRLETWGMPISEWKRTGKPMLVADLPYSHETVGDYGSVCFVDPYDAEALAREMRDFIHGNNSLSVAHAPFVEAPFAENWRQLFDLLLGSVAPAQDKPQ